MSLLKLVVLGDGGVGKSCLIIQYVRNQFVLDYDPTIEANYRKTILLNEQPVMLDILDTAGQEDYAVMRDQYIRTGEGFALVYSVCDAGSFGSLTSLHNKILCVLDEAEVPMVLIGNKSDLHEQRQVPTEEGATLARKLGIPFFECSAKLRTNVEEAFEELALAVVAARATNPQIGETLSSSPRGDNSGPIPKDARKPLSSSDKSPTKAAASTKQTSGGGGGGCVLL